MEIPRVNYKRSGITRDDQEKMMWNFQESWFLAVEFPICVT